LSKTWCDNVQDDLREMSRTGLEVYDSDIMYILAKNELIWHGALTYPKVFKWLKQFDVASLPHAKKLLSHFLHYADSSVQTMYRLLYERVLKPAVIGALIQRGTADSISGALNLFYEKIDKMLFVPMTAVGKSGPVALYSFLKVNGIRKGDRKDITRLQKTGTNGAVGIVFVDDFIGTGKQVIDECWPQIQRVRGLTKLEFLYYVAPIGLDSGL